MFDNLKRIFAVVSAMALASSLCIACDDDDKKDDGGETVIKKVNDSGETVTCKETIEIDYDKTSKSDIVDYLISVCRLSPYFKTDTAFINSDQTIGSPCFCYGPDCELAGYERPEQGKIFGCDNVQAVEGAVPICLRSSSVDNVKPAIYFPNGMCALALSKCTTVSDASGYICGFAKFGNFYTPDANGRLQGDEKADEETAKFTEAGCPEGSAMVKFEMNIEVEIVAGNPKTAKLDVTGCFKSCNTDSDCRTGEYDYILQDKGQIKCTEARPNEAGEKARVCFDERTVEHSSIGITTVSLDKKAE